MLEFIILMLVLVAMALAGFTVLAMLLVSGLFVLFGALAGMFALIIKLAPWLLVLLVVCWLISNRRKQSNTYR
ncbi:envelope stress response protein PspG [Aeromonas enterica]|jgi:phage shock protein G